MKKPQLFDQNHGLSPLQKCQFCLLFKSMFILSTKACFLTRTSPILFLGVFCIKQNVNEISNFWPKPWTNPFEKKANCVGFWNRYFCCSERLVCFIKRRKSFFHDLISRYMTWEYQGLQGVTGDYKGLQGVTGGYRGCKVISFVQSPMITLLPFFLAVHRPFCIQPLLILVCSSYHRKKLEIPKWNIIGNLNPNVGPLLGFL